MEKLLRSFVHWYAGYTASFDPQILSDDFAFLVGNLGFPREEIVTLTGSRLALGDFVVHAILVDNAQGGAFFDGTDTVCGIRYQYAWLVTFNATTITKVMEVRTQKVEFPDGPQVIDDQWDFLLKHEDAEVRRIATRAADEPALRRLFPYTSMSNLRFSAKTRYPYDAMPYILTAVPGERYEVRAADHESLVIGSLDDVVRAIARLLA